jgi:hypothetical protein
MDCKVLSSSFISCLLAPLAIIPIGNPCGPAVKPRFVPFFPPIGRIIPCRFTG